MACYEQHKTYQASVSDPESEHFVEKLSAGPLLSEDGFFPFSLSLRYHSSSSFSNVGRFMIGSCFLIHGTREDAERFVQNDPFTQNNVFREVTINRYFPVGAGIKSYP